MAPTVTSVLMSKRDIVASALDAASDAKTAFSSPSQCLKYNICKIPLIIGCVVAGLILLSCVCYFAACMRCLSCLCCGCCDSCEQGSRGSRRHGRARGYEAPTEMEYKAQPPPSYFSYAPNQQVGLTPMPAATSSQPRYEPVDTRRPDSGYADAYKQDYPDNRYSASSAPLPHYSGGAAQTYYQRQ